MANREQEVEQLFGAALERRPEDRREFLDHACADAPELRQRIEELLLADEQAGSFLERRLLDSVADQSDVTGGAETRGGPAPATHLQKGQIVAGRFVIVRLIARGGMGEVYEVEDRFLPGVPIALKLILPHIAAEPDIQTRFEREVLLARKLIHPNLCPIYDIFHCRHLNSHVTFLTMKLLPGETLANRIRCRGPIPVTEAKPIILQVAAAVTAVHEAGILHRDIKAANIILDGSGQQVHVYVTDFGLARAYQNESTPLTLTALVGTPGYIAPELFQGEAPSKASDVFAFGVVIYEMITGHLPRSSLLADSKTRNNAVLNELPAEWKSPIAHCLEQNASRRYQSIPEAVDALPLTVTTRRYPWAAGAHLSRRRVLWLGASAIAGFTGGVWLEWPYLRFLFEPLPDKRFVALMAWPTAPSGESTAILSTVLDSIGRRLARAETSVKDLLIISSRDLHGGDSVPTTPAESVAALGANLVLAASLQSSPSTVTLTLQVLDAASEHVLRRLYISSVPAELSSLPARATEASVRLLGLPHQEKYLQDPDELKHLSPEVFRLFSEAEELADQPNDAGLNGAVAKYQKALASDPHFAVGYARLAIAYVRQYLLDKDKAKLTLSETNAASSLRYNPGSAKGLLSQAIVYLYSGKTNEAFDYFAKCLHADPGNPETLLYKAQALRDLGRLQDAEAVYRDILAERPNYWPAYNELGWLLARQAKYQQAADAFDAAAAAAPTVALPLANLGTMYLELGKRAEAVAACNRSIERSPNEGAYLTLGDIAFGDGNYKAALGDYQRAAELDPKYHLVWRNIGDCYAMLGQPYLVKQSYAKAAQFLSEFLTTNPNSGLSWATLAFYHAKIGDAAASEADIKKANAFKAKDVESQFMEVQALAVLGKKEDALRLLLACMDRGLSTLEVNLALDLKELRKDPRYLSQVKKLQGQNSSPAS